MPTLTASSTSGHLLPTTTARRGSTTRWTTRPTRRSAGRPRSASTSPSSWVPASDCSATPRSPAAVARPTSTGSPTRMSSTRQASTRPTRPHSAQICSPSPILPPDPPSRPWWADGAQRASPPPIATDIRRTSPPRPPIRPTSQASWSSRVARCAALLPAAPPSPPPT